MTVREWWRLVVTRGMARWGALGRQMRKSRGSYLAGWLKTAGASAVDSLSGGERQRAWIAMLVAQIAVVCCSTNRPRRWISPTRLCAVAGAPFKSGAWPDGHCRVHDINMAARYCDYLVALRGGK